MKLLAFFDYFHPATKSGGPIMSSLGFVERLGKDFDITVFTRNRDKDGIEFNLPKNKVYSKNNYKIIYCSKNKELFVISKLIKKEEFDLFYFNSFFSFEFSILPQILIRLRNRKTKFVIAPRGELAKTALQYGYIKKLVYLSLYNAIIHKTIVWHATSDHEVNDIEKNIRHPIIKKARNLRPVSPTLNLGFVKSKKSINFLKIVCIARIHPVKNIKYAIEVLMDIKGEIRFDLYGFPENKEYLNDCLESAELLPPNIRFKYYGPIKNEEVISKIQTYDLFFLPTQGENFGHSIFESLLASRPVLISDATYFSAITSKNGGMAFNLSNKEKFRKAIEEMLMLDKNAHNKICYNAYTYAQNLNSRLALDIKEYSLLFES